LNILRAAEPGKAARIATLKSEGYPCYTTTVGWLGYSDDKLRRLCRQARAAGFTHSKFKVGADLDDDIRRLTIARQELGEDAHIMIDANPNQMWEVDQAIKWVKALSFARPLFIEEPTSPDDIAGHKTIRDTIAPIKVATGEAMKFQILTMVRPGEVRGAKKQEFDLEKWIWTIPVERTKMRREHLVRVLSRIFFG